MFHTKAESNFNKKASELISKLVVYEIDNEPNHVNKFGSSFERRVLHWSGKFDKSEGSYGYTIDGTNNSEINVFFEVNSSRITLENEAFDEFNKLVTDIYSVNKVNTKITKKALQDVLFKWIIGGHLNQQIISEFCNNLQVYIQEICQDLLISFRLLYINIPEEFCVGDVKFRYLTRDIVDTLQGAKDKAPKPIKDKYDELFAGMVLVEYFVENCSFEVAQEVAYDFCSIAVDILKCHSLTVRYPEVQLDFDMDNRVRVVENNMSFSYTDSSFGDFTIELKKRGEEFNILSVPKTHPLSIYAKASTTYNETRTVIRRSIGKFANSLSNNDLHERVVQLMSILDSIFITNQKQPIVNTISHYSAKLLKLTADERRQLKKDIKDLYDVRSDYVHRGKRTLENIDLLSRIQLNMYALLRILTILSYEHNDMKSICKWIDDELEIAFDPTSEIGRIYASNFDVNNEHF